MYPWRWIGLMLAVAALVWLYVATVRHHSRMASNLTIKPSARNRYDATHPNGRAVSESRRGRRGRAGRREG